ncbi:MAG TPA: 3D domain-containing protein [Hyphomonadaceae bacterium]|nr:3D domain-containing protein [Hyphomonadaceae bacterium]
MKRLLLALLLVVAGAAMFLGPPLRAAFASTHVDITLGRAELHPTSQALNFLLKPPTDDKFGKEVKLWATYYHMPTVRPAAQNIAAAKPLLGRNGKAISPPLSIADWCDAAMQGSVWVDNGEDEPTAYMYVDSGGPDQVACDRHFGDLSDTIKVATRHARFVPFHHPKACDVRAIPLMAFRTVAVDPAVFRIGTVLYIPSLRGKGFWLDGQLYAHDGYVVASDTGGAIEGNHIDMFVANANVAPFPETVHSNPRGTFQAFVVDKDDPAAIALKAANEEVCRDSDRPGRKLKRTAAPGSI